MVGIFSPFMVAGLLMASPAGFTFDGPEVTARTVGNVGYFTQGAAPFADLFERGTGSARFSARERIADPQATYGDAGSLEATFTLGATTYRVELDQPGFPPPQAGASQVAGTLPPPPAQAIAGGVVVNQELHGGAALGAPSMSRVHAAAALWGVGRVWRNGQLLTDTALIHAAALDRAAHADDDTFRVLPVAREGDTELSVLVWNLPRQLEPRGFIQFDFEDVGIAVNGLEVPAVAVVPSAGAFVGVAPPSAPVPGGVFLGGVATSNASSPTSFSPQQGTGGSGLANTGQTGSSSLDPRRLGTDAFSRTSERVAAASTSAANITETFQRRGRVAISDPRSEPFVFVPAPGVSDSFQNDQRVRLAEERPPATLNGFVPLTSSFAASPSTPSTSGSFSVVPLVPGVAGPEFAFGGDRVTTDVVATPDTLTSRAVAPPFIATPRPLNAQPALPLIATPRPLNAQPALPLIATPPPLNTQPFSATPSGLVAPPAGGAGR